MKLLPDQQKLRQWRYVLKHDIFNRQNLVIFGIIFFALIWLSSAVQKISQNYKQQKRLDTKLREAKVLELETLNLEYEQAYYRSQEYQELALRQKTDLVLPGEKVVILPEYSDWVRLRESELTQKNQLDKQTAPSNFHQWINFFFGAKSASLNNK